MFTFRIKVASFLVEKIRKYVVPSGCSLKYSLRKQVLDRVNAMNLDGAPVFSGDVVIGFTHSNR